MQRVRRVRNMRARETKGNMQRVRRHGHLRPRAAKTTMQRVRWVRVLRAREIQTILQRMRRIEILLAREIQTTMQRVRRVIAMLFRKMRELPLQEKKRMGRFLSLLHCQPQLVSRQTNCSQLQNQGEARHRFSFIQVSPFHLPHRQTRCRRMFPSPTRFSR